MRPARLYKSDSNKVWPTDLLDRIWDVISKPCPDFKFDMSMEAAQKNFCILAKHGLDLQRALDSQANLPVSYGSDFRPSEVLERIFGTHPLWYRMRPLLVSGSDWPLLSLSNDNRKEDLSEALAFSNHKGATSKPGLLKDLISKDVKHGYATSLQG